MHRIRIQLNATTMVAIVALVFAMTGGAFAVTGHSAAKKKARSKLVITSTKQIKPSVLKQLQGKIGKTGAAGVNGANGAGGAQGPAGANGKDGANGTNGTNGTNGAPGKSVVTTAITTAGLEGKCVGLGGTKVEIEGEPASKKFVCNGSPWTAGGTLPSKATEGGAWVIDQTTRKYLGNGGASDYMVPLTFPIPLAAPLKGSGCAPFNVPGEPCQIHIFEGATAPTGCKLVESGTETKEVAAEPGNLCVYVRVTEPNTLALAEKMVALNPGAAVGADALQTGKSGAMLQNFNAELPENSAAYGTWAVTAE